MMVQTARGCQPSMPCHATGSNTFPQPMKGKLMITAPSHAPCRPSRQALHGYLYSKLATRWSTSDNTDPNEDITPASADRDTTPKRTMPLLHRIAVHEASHAVIRLYLGLGTITEITIDAPHGGYVASRTDEYDEQTENLLTAQLSVMLAGRAGEEVITKTAGANGDGETEGSDHELATKLPTKWKRPWGSVRGDRCSIAGARIGHSTSQSIPNSPRM